MARNIQYFVEGECEEKFINTYKMPPIDYFLPGKVDVFNILNKKLSKPRILNIKNNAIIILVYDTDTFDTSILDENISMLKENGFNDIYHIQSIKTFEEEIIYSSKAKSINTIFKTQGLDEFKAKFIRCGNLKSKLDSVSFDEDKIWTRCSTNPIFSPFSSDKSNSFIRKK